MTNMQQHQQQQQQQQPSAPQNQQNQPPPQSASPTGSPDNNTNSGAHQGDGQFRHQLEILSKLGAANPAAGAVAQPRAPQQPVPGPSPHGYANGASSPAPDGLPASNNDPEAHIHPDLRARTAFAPVTNMMASGMPPPAVSPGAPSAGPSVPPPIQPQHQHQQPQLQPQPPPDMGGDPMSIDDTSPDGRKAKRELSQSKRAAQNRAAQRAFRQRKEGYIKKLEQQVRDYMEMESQYKQLQSESYALREYVIHLQSRMLDTQGEYPQPPPNVNLNQPPPPHLTQGPPAHQLQGPDGLASPQGPHAIPEQHLSHPPQEQEPVPQQPLPTSSAPAPPASDSAVGTPLEAVAQAVAGLAAQEQMAERQSYAAGKEYRPEPDVEVKHDVEADRQREDGMQAPTASM